MEQTNQSKVDHINRLNTMRGHICEFEEGTITLEALIRGAEVLLDQDDLESFMNLVNTHYRLPNPPSIEPPLTGQFHEG